ncbi:MAG: lytic transglycosylase domain-containing protein [Chlorobi bacterium]|nr:lytic transglycosylase domain-containing protein [Chlorobiota bacterium]
MINKDKTAFKFFMLGGLTTLTLVIIFSFTSMNKFAIADDSQEFPQNYKVVVPYIPDELEFAGERVPLENFDVRERIQREFIVSTYYHSATILYLQRANRWFPIIEDILDDYDVPDDFKYFALVESGLENLTSPMNAVGYWQLLKDTGKKYGLTINSEVDERYNMEKATEAACKYLLDSYERYRSWTLAAASYNMGKNGVSNQLERQKATNYYNLVLNGETTRYIPRVVALKYIFQNLKLYGFDIAEDELYPPYETYSVDVDSSVTHWADFAASYGINYKTLKLFNPWLRENKLTNKSKKVYSIKLPIEGTIKIIPD